MISCSIVYNIAAKDDGLSVNDIATIFIALVNLVLAFYVFIYQRNKDKTADRATAILNEKNIRLQWFKDIIIQPHFDILLNTFNSLTAMPNPFVAPDHDDYDQIVDNYLKVVKSDIYELRRNFLTLFEVADPTLFDNAVDVIDKLIDDLSIKLIDHRLDVSTSVAYESFITQEIVKTKNNLINVIYSFKG